MKFKDNSDQTMITKITGLQCEYCNNPLGVDTPKPRFSWQAEATFQGHVQDHYRILVSSDPRLLQQNTGDLWDSGKVNSNEQFGIFYEGKPLIPMTRYWWKVMVWDKQQAACNWSQSAYFVTGVFKVHHWQGKFFQTYGCQVRFARREFELTSGSPVKEAWMFIAARGAKQNTYVGFINGDKVGVDF